MSAVIFDEETRATTYEEVPAEEVKEDMEGKLVRWNIVKDRSTAERVLIAAVVLFIVAAIALVIVTKQKSSVSDRELHSYILEMKARSQHNP